MGSNITLKIDSLRNQLDMLKSEIELSEKTKHKPNGGLKKLKGILKGKGDFSEKDFAAVRFSFPENL